MYSYFYSIIGKSIADVNVSCNILVYTIRNALILYILTSLNSTYIVYLEEFKFSNKRIKMRSLPMYILAKAHICSNFAGNAVAETLSTLFDPVFAC